MAQAKRKHTTEPTAAARNRSSDNFATCEAVGIHEIMRGLLQAHNEVELTFDTESEPGKDILRELFDARDAYEHILTFNLIPRLHTGSYSFIFSC
jgi:hypothetical protein